MGCHAAPHPQEALQSSDGFDEICSLSKLSCLHLAPSLGTSTFTFAAKLGMVYAHMPPPWVSAPTPEHLQPSETETRTVAYTGFGVTLNRAGLVSCLVALSAWTPAGLGSATGCYMGSPSWELPCQKTYQQARWGPRI